MVTKVRRLTFVSCTFDSWAFNAEERQRPMPSLPSACCLQWRLGRRITRCKHSSTWIKSLKCAESSPRSGAGSTALMHFAVCRRRGRQTVRDWIARDWGCAGSGSTARAVFRSAGPSVHDQPQSQRLSTGCWSRSFSRWAPDSMSKTRTRAPGRDECDLEVRRCAIQTGFWPHW